MKELQIVIRSADAEDWAGIVRVHNEAIFGKASSHYSQNQIKAWADAMTHFSEDASLNEKDKQNAVTLVAERDGKIVGFASAVPSKGLLKSVYVASGNGPNLANGCSKKSKCIRPKKALRNCMAKRRLTPWNFTVSMGMRSENLPRIGFLETWKFHAAKCGRICGQADNMSILFRSMLYALFLEMSHALSTRNR